MISVHEGRTFDRIPHWDERNAYFKLSAVAHPESVVLEQRRRTRHWTVKTLLDQGSLGSCVGNGCAHYCIATPLPQTSIDETTAVRIYKEAQNRDEWPGNDYEGTSLLAGMKALQTDERRISGYLWLTDTDEIAKAIGYVSPVVIAVNWRQGMMDVDSAGRIHATGATVGGHCVCVSGYDDKTKMFMIAQSWGKEWGRSGFAEISEDDMASLLRSEGEAVLPRKVRVKA